MADRLPDLGSSGKLEVSFSAARSYRLPQASQRPSSSVHRHSASPSPASSPNSGIKFRTASACALFEDRTTSPCSFPSSSAAPSTAATEAGAPASPSLPSAMVRMSPHHARLSSTLVWELANSELPEGPSWSEASRPSSLAHLASAFSAVNPGRLKPLGLRLRRQGPEEAAAPSRGSHPPPCLHLQQLQQLQQQQQQGSRSRVGETQEPYPPSRAAVDSKISPKEKNKSAKKLGGVMEQLMCGAFAGVVSRTAIAPIDLVRTHLISSHGMDGVHKTAASVLKAIVDKDGWVGLFRGNGINCLRVAPNKAIELCTFEMLKRNLCGPGHPLQRFAAPLAGGAAGMAGTIATYPLEVMRTRISVQPERYANLVSTFNRMIQEEGYWSLYKGLPISLFGVFPYAATNYFVYDALRGLYRKATGRDKVPTGATLVFGALAASVSSAVTFPLEVARRRLQLGAVAGRAAPTSGLQVITQIVEKEGWRAVYRGLGTTWLKLIPAAGISFVCYEAARCALRVDDASYAAAAAAAAAASAAQPAVGPSEMKAMPVRSLLVERSQDSQRGVLALASRAASEQGVPHCRHRTAQQRYLASGGCTGALGEKHSGQMSGASESLGSDAVVSSFSEEEQDCKGGLPLLQVGSSQREFSTSSIRIDAQQDFGWGKPMSYPPLPSPFGLGSTLVAVRDGLVEAEDLQLLRKHS